MGKGTDSFKKEIGKNTGKYISTKLFGDKHATPHKIIIAREENKIDEKRKSNDFKLEEKRIALNLKKSEQDKIENYYNKKENIISQPLSNDKQELFDFSNYLIGEIKSNGWSTKDENAHLNEFSDTCYNKLIQCKIKLQSINAQFEVEHIETELKSLKNKKLFQKYALYAGIAIAILGYLLLKKLGIIDK